MRSRFGQVMALYAATGMTGLAYEVLWVRMVGTLFGADQLGVVVTVTAFMLGLGLGGFAGRRLVERIGNPLMMFALLEALVAAHAILLPLAVDGVDDGLASLGGGLTASAWTMVELASAVAVLMVPAAAMGMAFPMVLAAAGDGGRHLGSLYGVNALGAAAGALLPLVLLPMVGWADALHIVAGLGMAVAFIAASLAWRQHDRRAGRPSPVGPAAAIASRRRSWMAYAIVGMAAIMLEIAWTRFYSLLFLRTEYVLAIVLAVYVTGIGIGGLLGQRLRPRRSLDLIPLLLVCFIGLGLWGGIELAGWIEARRYDSLSEALIVQGGVMTLLTLPVTIILGAWLPLLHRIDGGGAAGVGFYAVNAAGSAAGAIVAGLVLIPSIGTTAVVCVAAALLFLAGLQWVEDRRRVLVPGLVLVAATTTLWDFPSVARLLPQSLSGSRDLYRFEDALATTHVIERSDGERVLLSDLQRMDAASDPASVASQKDQARLALWLHPDAERILFLGLGTGITAAGIPAGVAKERVAVELSKGAIVAARDWFDRVNAGIVDGLEVVNDDVRRFLVADARLFDLVVGDLFHPDLVGRGALLSRQQFERVRRRLAPGGIYVQWLALNQFDREALTSVLRTFEMVYPDARMFVDGFRLALVGPAGAWRRPSLGSGLPGIVRSASVDSDEDAWTWAGRYWGWPRLAPGPVEDEWRPHIEYALPRARYRGDVDLVTMIGWLEAVRPPLASAAAGLDVAADGRDRFERAYMATSLALRSWKEGLLGNTANADRLLRFARRANPGDRWIAWSLADRMMETLPEAIEHGVGERRALDEILSIMPDHPGALARLWHLEERNGRHRRAEGILRRLEAISPYGYRQLVASSSQDGGG